MMHNCYFIMYTTRFFRYKMNLQMNYSNRNFISTTLYILKLTLNLSQKQKQSNKFLANIALVAFFQGCIFLVQPFYRFRFFQGFRVLSCKVFIGQRFQSVAFLLLCDFIRVQSFYRVEFLQCSVFIWQRFYRVVFYWVIASLYMVAFLSFCVFLGQRFNNMITVTLEVILKGE